MTQNDKFTERQESDLDSWVTTWAGGIDPHDLAPQNGGTVQATLDLVVRDAITEALTPWLRDPINPNDETLLAYSFQILARDHVTCACLPEFRAAPFPITEANDKGLAAVMRRTLQDRIDRSLPIPGDSRAGWDDMSLQSLDVRSCRILRLHQARLNLGHTVTQFCAALSVTEDYFHAMLKLDDNKIPTDTISRCLGTARALLRHNGSATTQRSQQS